LASEGRTLIVRGPATAIAEAKLVNTKAAPAQVTEGVRAALALYAQALDDGRTDEVVATFCADGVCEMPGLGTHRGHAALREAYAKWKPKRPQRHLVFNTVVTEEDEGEATAISDVVLLLWGDSGWAIELVGRYHDLLHLDDGRWRFHHRSANFVTGDLAPEGTP
jgi:hypothetical protein